LVVYLLLLLAAGLGAFTYLIFGNACDRLDSVSTRIRQTLRASADHEHQRQNERFQATQRAVRANFDEALLSKAQTLANQAQAHQFTRQLRNAMPIMVAGLLGARTQGPSAQVLLPLWLVEGNPDSKALMWHVIRCNHLDEVKVHDTFREDQADEFYQVATDGGRVLQRSPTLGNDYLPLTAAAALELKVFGHRFDDAPLSDGKKVRVVTLKWAVRMPLPVPGPGNRNGRRIPGSSNWRAPEREDAERGRLPTFVLQYATPTTESDELLANLAGGLDQMRQEIEAELDANLRTEAEQARIAQAALQAKLLLVALSVFGIAALGAVWLIHRGLKPIGRITEAVSQVSEKDFQLNLRPEATPQELTAIVDKLHDTLASLKGAFDREKQAAADISHELRTPIASLLATIQVCLRKPRPAEEYRQVLQTCADIGRQLRDLVERLLILARLDAGSDLVSAELVDVADLAGQCVGLVRPLAETKGLTVGLEEAPGPPVFVETDGGKLRDVLVNLLHNALQYNRPEGRVTVRVERDGGEAVLTVTDTGVGIAPEALPHLFERFYRADPSRQADTIHAGLGLAIVKGYLDLMGGTIQVASVPGQGSAFEVRLPRAAAGPEADEKTAAAASGGGQTWQ
jgi:heavy metal sensor kinase